MCRAWPESRPLPNLSMQTRRTRRFRPTDSSTLPAAPVCPAAPAPDAIVRRRTRPGRRRSVLTDDAARGWRVVFLVVLAAVAFRPLDALCRFIDEEYHKAAVAVGFGRGGVEAAWDWSLPTAAGERARNVPTAAAGPTHGTVAAGASSSPSFHETAAHPYHGTGGPMNAPVSGPSGGGAWTGGQTPARATAFRAGSARLSGPAAVASGGTFGWSGAVAGTSAYWSNAGNWTGGTAPTPTGNADIGFTATPATATASTVDTNYTINSLSFQAGTPAYTIGNANNATLTINGGGITDASVNAQTLTVPVALGANQSWNVAASTGVLAVNGKITGSNGFTKTGPGTLVLGGSASNTYTGLTSVTAGTLAFSKPYNGTVIFAVPGDLSIGNATNPGAPGSAVAQFRNIGQTAATTNVTIYPDGVLDVGNGSGSGGTNNGATINNLTMTGGELRLGAGYIGPTSITTLASATTALISSTNSYDNVELNNLSTPVVANVARGTATYDLDVRAGMANGALTKTGDGVMRLAGHTNGGYGGSSVTLEAGTLALADNGVLGTGFNAVGSSTFTFAGGTVTADSGDRTIANPISLTGDGTIGASLDGTPRAISFTGATTLTGSRTLTVNNTAATTFAAVNLNGANTLTMAGTGNTLVSGAISDAGKGGSLTMSGTGTLTLTGANTYTGGTTFAGGVLNAGSAGALGSTGTLGFTGGTLQYSAANQTDYSPRFSSAADQAYSVDTNGQNVSFATALTSSGGSLTKLGAGTLTLTGASTYTGNTAVNAGTLAITGSVGVSEGGGNLNVDGGVGGTAATTISSTGSLSAFAIKVGGAGNGTFTQSGSSTVQVGYFLAVGNDDSNGNTGLGTYNLQGGTLVTSITYVGDSNNSSPSVFNQTGGQHAAGQLEFGYQNTNSVGTYNLDGGVLNSEEILANAGTGTFNFNGGTLQAGVSSPHFFQGITTANVRNGGAVIDTDGFDVTVAQPLVHSTISGDNATDGGLTKNGAGMLTLTGNNTYTGTTLVNDGALIVNNVAAKAGDSGTGSGPVYVGQGTWLGGTGTIGGNVTVGAYPPNPSQAHGVQPQTVGGSGTLTPGVAVGDASTPGRLTINGMLTFTSGTSVLEADLAGANAGTGYDQVRVGGNLSLAGTLTLTIGAGFTPTLLEKFYLIDLTGTGTVSGTFDGLANPFLVTDSAGNEYAINYNDHDPADTSNLLPNDVSLTAISVVPEPGTWALLGLGIIGLCGLAVRRARHA